MDHNMIAWHSTSAPADTWCSRCDKKLMSREIEYAWIGHDVHAHLQVMSSCCSAAVVDRPEAHLALDAHSHATRV